jgi:hypothetical protein
VKTIYDAAGVTDPTAGLFAAVGRANAALARSRATVPAGVPEVSRPTRPTPTMGRVAVRVLYSECSDSYSVQARNPSGSWTSGSISGYILSGTSPADLLSITVEAESLSVECERMADQHAADLAAATGRAVADARPALAELQRRTDAARMADEVRSLRERVIVLEAADDDSDDA